MGYAPLVSVIVPVYKTEKFIHRCIDSVLNQTYSMPGRFVHTFLQVTEQVWHPMHLSRFKTIVT